MRVAASSRGGSTPSGSRRRTVMRKHCLAIAELLSLKQPQQPQNSWRLKRRNIRQLQPAPEELAHLLVHPVSGVL